MQSAKKLFAFLGGEICLECLIITLFLGVMVFEIASLS